MLILTPTPTLENLLTALYKHPPTSKQFNKIRQTIVDEHLSDKKYDEKIIVFKSLMHPDCKPHTLHMLDGVVDADNPDLETLFSSHEGLGFLEDPFFEIKTRRDVEYNPLYRQLVIGVVFIGGDGQAVLLETLEDGDTRINGKTTMIQGHVEFFPEIYTHTQRGFLWKNLVRECFEEVQFSERVEDLLKKEPQAPRFFINDRTSLTGIEHFGIIYEIHMGRLDTWANGTVSNELEKHRVMVDDIESFLHEDTKLDPWARKVLMKMNRR